MIVPGSAFLRDRPAVLKDTTAMAESEGGLSHQQGVWAMKYVIGFIVGVALTIGGAWFYDNAGAGVASPLVNWTTANDLVRTAVDDVKVQFDRLVKQLGG
jgi:hypothetical protein